MSVAVAALPRVPRAVFLGVGLCAAVALRTLTNGATVSSAFIAGALFGVALLALAFTGPKQLPIRLPSLASVALGLAGGAALIVVPLALNPIARPVGLRPEPFVAWAAVTSLVAVAEEALLRGALLDAIADAAGIVPAVLLTTLAFALMHVPLYGWSVVPVDFGAGLVLCGLRLLSRGIAAPAIAHTLADLATWWL